MSVKRYREKSGYVVLAIVLISITPFLNAINEDTVDTKTIISSAILFLVLLSIAITAEIILRKKSYIEFDGKYISIVRPFGKTHRIRMDDVERIDTHNVYFLGNSFSIHHKIDDKHEEAKFRLMSKSGVRLLVDIETTHPELLGNSAKEYLDNYRHRISKHEKTD